MVDAQKILLFLVSIKGVLMAFGIDVFSTEQAEAIANGIAALIAVGIAAYNMIKKAQAESELAQLKSFID